jgi:phospholipid/cholesterol/gamma-HCH transport system permease protein
LISFLIGFILALQSAAQLRQFGANIFIADLIGIAMLREMGPIMTAIVVAGRSGSAIASEIATMVVTEEVDALKTMSLNPIRYVVVPKFHGITLTMPLLTIFSDFLGILGGFIIGITYLQLSATAFLNELATVVIMKDVLTGLFKSIIFAWIIIIVACYYGLKVTGGSEGVGKATTASVVASIFYVIIADSIMGLIFYFDQPIY